jgi:hypothetical protein
MFKQSHDKNLAISILGMYRLQMSSKLKMIHSFMVIIRLEFSKQWVEETGRKV